MLYIIYIYTQYTRILTQDMEKKTAMSSNSALRMLHLLGLMAMYRNKPSTGHPQNSGNRPCFVKSPYAPPQKKTSVHGGHSAFFSLRGFNVKNMLKPAVLPATTR